MCQRYWCHGRSIALAEEAVAQSPVHVSVANPVSAYQNGFRGVDLAHQGGVKRVKRLHQELIELKAARE